MNKTVSIYVNYLFNVCTNHEGPNIMNRWSTGNALGLIAQNSSQPPSPTDNHSSAQRCRHQTANSPQ